MHVENLKSTAPEIAAQYDGAAYMVSNNPSYEDLGREVERIALARRLATANGVNLKVFSKWRCDIFGMHRSGIVPAEFDPAWILQGSADDLPERIEIIHDWLESGFALSLNPYLDMDRFRRFHGGFPIYYAHGRTDPVPGIEIYALLTDLRNPDYRAFAVEHCRRIAEVYSLDGILLDAKLGWHSHGSPARSTPRNHPQAGGTFYPSPYGPGEFEAAFADLLRELAAVDIRPVLITRPKRPQDAEEWDWMPEGVEQLPLAEYI